MNAKKFSLLLAGLIWISVGLRIGSRALGWLEPIIQEPNWSWALIILSLAIGIGKSATVLKKAVERNFGNIKEIPENIKGYTLGWFKLFGPKGLIIILIMIALGFGLRFLQSIIPDPLHLFAFIYLGIAIALGLSSRFYFSKLTQI